MSDRIQGMIKILLSAMGIDPKVVQEEVLVRVNNFERDFQTLAANIAKIHHDNAEIKHNLRRVIEHAGREWETVATANGDARNANTGDKLLTDTRSHETV
jgi:hypothetical protein